MEQVPIRELNQDTAGVLARVQHGATVEITNRGQPIARIVPIANDPMRDLVASGLALPPTSFEPIHMPTLAAIGEDAGQLLTQMRDEERW